MINLITPTEAKKAGIKLNSKMNKLYPNGMVLQGDSVSQGYLRAWHAFLQEMMADIQAQGVTWDSPYRFSIRIFFAADDPTHRRVEGTVPQGIGRISE